MNYYNEFDPKAAAWLQELINQKLIPAGVVDTRSITEITPNDLRPYTQCHFFAGIGGWSYALQLAGWPTDRPVGSASCPCQPFSTAGKRLGEEDERHLWPVFFRILVECRKAGQSWTNTVFGEQVANAIGKGWLDGISADLESENYTCGAAVLGAHSVGAPHIRQRLYWVADNWSRGREVESVNCRSGCETEPERETSVTGVCGAPGWVVNMQQQGLERLVGDEYCGGEPRRIDADTVRPVAETSGVIGGLGDSDVTGFIPRGETTPCLGYGDSSDAASFWSESQLAICRDGKTRRVPTEPTFFPLDHGVPARVVRLRGYGNAIVPQVAAEFIKAWLDVTDSPRPDSTSR